MAEHRGGSGNFAEDREKASEAGRKGGQHSGGNFKNDPERASEAGKKGGENSHSGGKNNHFYGHYFPNASEPGTARLFFN